MIYITGRHNPEKQKPLRGRFSVSQSLGSRIQKKAPLYRYIHIATHGLINEKRPALSGIIFSQTPESVMDEDGILYAGEIYNLNLSSELVVLSSCESGIG